MKYKQSFFVCIGSVFGVFPGRLAAANAAADARGGRGVAPRLWRRRDAHPGGRGGGRVQAERPLSILRAVSGHRRQQLPLSLAGLRTAAAACGRWTVGVAASRGTPTHWHQLAQSHEGNGNAKSFESTQHLFSHFLFHSYFPHTLDFPLGILWNVF